MTAKTWGNELWVVQSRPECGNDDEWSIFFINGAPLITRIDQGNSSHLRTPTWYIRECEADRKKLEDVVKDLNESGFGGHHAEYRLHMFTPNDPLTYEQSMKNKVLTNHVETRSTVINERNSRIEVLEDQVHYYDMTIDTLQKQVTNLQNRLSNLTSQLEEAQQYRNAQSARRNDIIADLRKQLSDAKVQNLNLLGTIVHKKYIITNLKRKIKSTVENTGCKNCKHHRGSKQFDCAIGAETYEGYHCVFSPKITITVKELLRDRMTCIRIIEECIAVLDSDHKECPDCNDDPDQQPCKK